MVGRWQRGAWEKQPSKLSSWKEVKRQCLQVVNKNDSNVFWRCNENNRRKS